MSDEQLQKLIDAGVALIHRKGFARAGIREIVETAGIPQGSFTNYFRSKEAFGVIVLQRAFQDGDRVMRATLENTDLRPVDRLNAYFDCVTEMFASAGWRYGCLIADLAAEMPAQSEPIRLALVDLLQQQAARFECAVNLAMRDRGGCTGDLGAFVLAAWQGTLLRMKVERDGRAIDRFRRVMASIICPDLLPPIETGDPAYGGG
ncbi:TetR/AcrR family transcriptional regulator [Agrobacterium pusense]|uniref:TetR/AcrR family transcriptional regulator n=1 Tax=Agrobacterium pusense TaxID=648995 RepID=UPI002896AA15|nr:TetR/AcrR family transcriptional regulator [Agrobacterium pusense]